MQSAVEYPQDEETRRQIPFASRYKVNSSGEIQIVDKDRIKQDLGCSPDRAERWAMGIWGLQFVNESIDIDEKFMDFQAPDAKEEFDYNPLKYGTHGSRKRA